MFLENSINILKKIRIKYNLSPREICYGIIDTSYLSHLEAGRKVINEDTLKLLVDRYNLLSEEKILNFKLNKKILLLPLEKKRKIIFDALIKKINNQNINLTNTLNSYNFLFKYLLPEENSIFLHKLIINFYNESKWEECLSYSLRFLQIESKDKDYTKRLSQIILIFTVAIICNGDYDRIKEIEYLINKEIYIFEEVITEKILLNTMNCFSRLNDPKKVFFYISIYDKIIKNCKLKKGKEHIEAISLNKNKEYEKSLKLYKKMLKEYEDIETQLTCNINITYILKNQGKLKNINYRYKTIKELLEKNISSLPLKEIRLKYYFLGEISVLLDKKSDAFHYYKLLLELENEEHLEGYYIDKYYEAINYLISSTKKNDTPTINLIKDNILKFNKIEPSSTTISAFVEFLTKSKNTDILLDFLNELNKKS